MSRLRHDRPVCRGNARLERSHTTQAAELMRAAIRDQRLLSTRDVRWLIGRASFGFGTNVPDVKTIWLFREHLS